MKSLLFWRMVAPSLLVSLLLLAVGLGAAYYVYAWNSRVATDLDRRLEIAVQANEIVLDVRDIRVTLDQYRTSKDARHIEEASKQASQLLRAARDLQDSPTLDDEVSLDTLMRSVETIESQARQLASASGEDMVSIRDNINSAVLPAAYALRDATRQLVVDASRQNQHVAGLLGTSIAVLALCGAMAGLLAGYSVARTVSMSIAQLGGSVESLAGTLRNGADYAPQPIQGLRDLVNAMTLINHRTVGVVSELEQSRDMATRADQLSAVGQLAAGIAHELRNPLTAVKLLVDSAVEQHQPLPPDAMQVIQHEVERMDGMLSSFLDFARTPKLTRRPLDLCEVVAQTADLVRPRAVSQGVALKCHLAENLPILADAQQIRQVVLNLLINALDAQPKGGEIAVDVAEGFLAGAPTAVLEVSDCGPGVAPEVTDTIFEPFVSTKETGVGLGLAICRRIILNHGGSLERVQSRYKGATFRIHLPLESVSADRE